MSNLENWIRAILNEDADNLSIGSVRTLQMIKQEFQSKEQEIAQLKIDIEMTRLGWNGTIDKKEEYQNQAKALSAVKKGMGKSLEESFKEIAEAKKEVERLRVLIKRVWQSANYLGENRPVFPLMEPAWQQFKTENNL